MMEHQKNNNLAAKKSGSKVKFLEKLLWMVNLDILIEWIRDTLKLCISNIGKDQKIIQISPIVSFRTEDLQGIFFKYQIVNYLLFWNQFEYFRELFNVNLSQE